MLIMFYVQHTHREEKHSQPPALQRYVTSLTCSLSFSSGMSRGSFIHWLTVDSGPGPTAVKTQHNAHPLSIIIARRPKQHIVLCS